MKSIGEVGRTWQTVERYNGDRVRVGDLDCIIHGSIQARRDRQNTLHWRARRYGKILKMPSRDSAYLQLLVWNNRAFHDVINVIMDDFFAVSANAKSAERQHKTASIKRLPHKTVKVQVGQLEADIDEGIAPLIKELWAAGIMTLNSCEENRPGIVWVQFATAEDCARFLDIVTVYETGLHSLYNRVTERWSSDDPKTPVTPWEYQPFPEDLALEEWITEEDTIEESHPGVPEFVFSMSVRFPRSDLPALVERLSRYNAICRSGVDENEYSTFPASLSRTRRINPSRRALGERSAPFPGSAG